MKKLLCLALLLAVLVLSFSGCGSFFGEAEVMIKDIEATPLENGDTLVTIIYTDDRIEPLIFTVPKGDQGDEGKKGDGIDEIKTQHVGKYTEIMITYTDGRPATIFTIPDGCYTTDAKFGYDEVAEQNYIQFTYSDGTKSDFIYIGKPEKGEKGDPGIGIDTATSGITESPDGNSFIITINFTDGSPAQTVSFPKSVGIADIQSSSDDYYYYLLIKYTNGEITTLKYPLPTRWLSGQGTPGSSIGREGDYYLDEDGKKIYRKINGEWDDVITLGDATPLCRVTFDLNAYVETADGAVRDDAASFDGYSSKFNFNKGDCFASNNYANGDIPIPTRDGYEFAGWYAKRNVENTLTSSAFTDLTPISSDITLYARWIPIAE